MFRVFKLKNEEFYLVPQKEFSLYWWKKSGSERKKDLPKILEHANSRAEARI